MIKFGLSALSNALAPRRPRCSARVWLIVAASGFALAGLGMMLFARARPDAAIWGLCGGGSSLAGFALGGLAMSAHCVVCGLAAAFAAAGLTAPGRAKTGPSALTSDVGSGLAPSPEQATPTRA